MEGAINPVNFIIALNFDQPVGRSKDGLSKVYYDSYLPLFELFERFPSVKLNVRLSGTIYEWLEEAHPEFIERIKVLVRRGQLEVMSGGFYSPVIPLIPESDAISQIKLENEFIKKHFLRVPRGIWLTGYAWEPYMPRLLAEAEMEYAILSDDQFHKAGIDPQKTFGYYVADEHGQILKLFPAHSQLNGHIPFSSAQEAVDHIIGHKRESESDVLVFADDGNKFGALNGTKKWIFEDKWLEKFLELLQGNKDAVRTVTFSEYIDENGPLGNVNIPSSSGPELAEISLTYDNREIYDKKISELKSFGKLDDYRNILSSGGYYRAMLSRYPELNDIHKKMSYISRKLSSLEKGKSLGFFSGERDKRIEEARRHLLKGQCGANIFTDDDVSLYQIELRSAICSELIASEVMIDRIGKGEQKFIEVKTVDLDKDGYDEVLVSSNLLNCYFAPSRGGSIIALDHKMKKLALSNIMSRYREPDHNRANDIDLVVDENQKLSLLDHFMLPDVTFEEYRLAKYEKLNEPSKIKYTASLKSTSNEAVIKMKGRVNIGTGEHKRVFDVIKTISMFSGQTQMMIDYEVINASEQEAEVLFGVELDIAFGNQGYYLFDNKTKAKITSFGEENNVSSAKIIDEANGIGVSLESADLNTFWRYPIETLSKVGGSMVNINQGISVLLSRRIEIAKGSSLKTKIRLSIE